MAFVLFHCSPLNQKYRLFSLPHPALLGTEQRLVSTASFDRLGGSFGSFGSPVSTVFDPGGEAWIGRIGPLA